MDELRKCAEDLIQRAAGKSITAIEALQFSQAACNVANAMAQLQNIEKQGK